MAAILVVPIVSFASIRTAKAKVVKTDDTPSKVVITAKLVITNDDRAKAGDIFKEKCATCHGDDGRGNGPAAANLKPRPIDFHSHNWQKSASDDKITKAIIFGGRAVGLSGQMAPNPDLENEPAIVAALVERIRKFGK